MNSHVVQWFDFEQGYGEIEIGDGRVYRYVPSPAGDLGPDELGRVSVRLVEKDGEPVEGDEYVCRSHANGRVSCSCPDWQYRKGPTGEKCKHLEALTDFGIVREPEPELVMETPW